MSRRLLPREKALKFGVSALEDYELVAILLSTGTNRMDVFTLARSILDDFNLRELAELPVKSLMQIGGIGPAKAVRLAAAFEVGRRVFLPPEGFLDHEGVKFMLRDMAKSRREMLLVAMYDAAGRFLGKEVVAVGSMNVVHVHMREVFEPIFRTGATRFIVAHNHPDGGIEPSPEDREFSRRVEDLAEALGFVLVESFVVGRGRAVGILGGTLIDLT